MYVKFLNLEILKKILIYRINFKWVLVRSEGIAPLIDCLPTILKDLGLIPR